MTESRKAKLGHLTSQANQLERLMEDDANVNAVKQKLRLEQLRSAQNKLDSVMQTSSLPTVFL